jgi:hypothetical protein
MLICICSQFFFVFILLVQHCRSSFFPATAPFLFLLSLHFNGWKHWPVLSTRCHGWTEVNLKTNQTTWRPYRTRDILSVFFAWHMTLGSPGNFLITLLFLAIATFLVKLFDRSNDIRLLLNIQALTFWLFLKRAEGQTLKNWTVYTTRGATAQARVGHKRGKT